MKKRSISLLLAVPISVFALTACSIPGPSAGGWPESIRSNFLNACNSSSADQTAYCQCSLEALEKAYTAEEFARLETQMADDPTILEELQQHIIPCVSELN